MQDPEQKENAEPLFRNEQSVNQAQGPSVHGDGRDGLAFRPMKTYLGSGVTGVMTDCERVEMTGLVRSLNKTPLLTNNLCLNKIHFDEQFSFLNPRKGGLWGNRVQSYSLWYLFWFLYETYEI